MESALEMSMICQDCKTNNLGRLGIALNLDREIFLHVESLLLFLPASNWLCDGCWDYYERLHCRKW